MNDDTLLSWKKCTQDDCGQSCALSRVRVAFDEDSHVDLWFGPHALQTLSATAIKEEAHNIVTSLLAQAEGDDATAAAAVIMVSGAATDNRSTTDSTSSANILVESTLANNALADNMLMDNMLVDDTSADSTSTDCTSTDKLIGSTSTDDASTANTSTDSVSTDSRSTDHTTAAAAEYAASLGHAKNTNADVAESATATPKDTNATTNAAATATDTANSRIFRETSPSVDVDTGSFHEKSSSPVAYQARLRLCSVVLHFRSKGSRPGAFLFLAFPEGGSVPRNLGTSDFGGIAGDKVAEAGMRVGVDVEQGVGVGRGERAGRVAMGGGRETGTGGREGMGVGVEVGVGRGRGEGAGAGVAAELWVTDETAPLLPSLRSQWAAAAAAQSLAGGGDGDSSLRNADIGEGSTPQHHHHHYHRHRFHDCCPPVLTLVAVPSAKAPLPPLCCGVCGSSWEVDSFGKGFRVYHIAVATNSSLVWYLRKRFSEFLELHAALLSGGGGLGGWGRGERREGGGGGDRGGEGTRISKNRLPKPPRRTFGLMRIFPEKAERFRRGELEAYLQALLLIPEAMTNPAMLSFLGLVSTIGGASLLSPPARGGMGRERRASKRRVGGGRGREGAAGGERGSEKNQREGGDATTASPAASTASLRTDRDHGAAGAETLFRRPANEHNGSNGGNESSARRGVALAGSRGRDCHNDAVLEVRGGESARPRRGGKDGQAGGGESARADGKGGGGGSGEGMRKVESVSNLDRAARGGDVVLFRCRGLLSRLQRWVSRSEWDHVGLVVSIGPGLPLELLESTPAGVRLYPLVQRVRAYQEQGFASKVAFRRLTCPRPAEALTRLEAFARKAEGKAYGIVLPFTPGWPQEPPPRPKTPPSCGHHPSPRPTPPRSPATAFIGDEEGGCAVNIPGSVPPSKSGKSRPPSPIAMPRFPTATTAVVGHEEGGCVVDSPGSIPPLGSCGMDVPGPTTPPGRCVVDIPGSIPSSRGCVVGIPGPMPSAGVCVADIPGSILPSKRGKIRLTPPPPPPSYLCSQLVAAALSEMGVLREGENNGGDGGWLWIFPGAFGQGGAVERGLGPGVALGEEVLVDAHEPEVGSAVLFGHP